MKIYTNQNVYDACKERISFVFDEFEKIYVSFSGGKDSTTMMHLVLDEAIKRNKKVGILIIDLEAQYTATIKHIEDMIKMYEKHIDVYWVCLPLSLRNSVSNFEPRWICWDDNQGVELVRDYPKECIKDLDYFDFFQKGMEFEEFMVLFGKWYSKNKKTAAFIGIRADESLNRFRTINSKTKIRYKNKSFTTLVEDSLYNIYPIYDWKVLDVWLYHKKNINKVYNIIYDRMHKAGLTPSQMRLCQPYGDDQKKGLWLYHILEPETWYKLIKRVNGVNSGALYINETGNINGYNKVTKPKNHTWKSFANLLLKSLPKKTSEHYKTKFITYLKWWKKRGYEKGIPQEAPYELESKRLVPSWRRICKTLLRNDYWCKGLCFSQPKSEAYGKYLKLRKDKQK